MKIDSYRDINKVHKKLLLIPLGPSKAEGTALKIDEPIKDPPVV